jgi:hypothetical protein
MYALHKQYTAVNPDTRTCRNGVSRTAISSPTMRAPSGLSPQLVASPPHNDETRNRSTSSATEYQRHHADKHRYFRGAEVEPVTNVHLTRRVDGAPQDTERRDVITKSVFCGAPAINATSVDIVSDAPQQQQYRNTASRLQSAPCKYINGC